MLACMAGSPSCVCVLPEKSLYWELFQIKNIKRACCFNILDVESVFDFMHGLISIKLFDFNWAKIAYSH